MAHCFTCLPGPIEEAAAGLGMRLSVMVHSLTLTATAAAAALRSPEDPEIYLCTCSLLQVVNAHHVCLE
jgi:hypothetical protein